MKSNHHLALPPSAYYAPTPLLTVDEGGRVVDYNLALQVLLGADMDGCRYLPVAHLLERAASRLSGAIFPSLTCSPGDGSAPESALGIRSAACRYTSASYGPVELRGTAVCHIDPSSGGPAGATLFLEVLRMEEADQFAHALHRRWEHELAWEVYAASYDRVLPRLPFYQEVVGRHIEAMSAEDVREVADLGAGTGNVTIPLLRAGRHVTAVDISRAMLDRLRAKGASPEGGALTVLEESAEHLPSLPDEAFDGVTVLLSFYDMGDPERGLWEALRILRPGGCFVTTEPKQCFDLRVLLEFAESHLRERGLWEKLHADWDRVRDVNLVLDPGPRAPLRAEVIRDRLASEGFVDVTMRDSHLGQCATVMGRKPPAHLPAQRGVEHL
jgi:ubiquinone/menaquinone biosynthesis C-methylase UbiE